MFKSFLVALLLSISSISFAESFVEGKDYEVLETPIPGNYSKPEIIDFFWYGCPHCKNFEKFTTDWKNANESKVTYKYFPAAFSQQWAESSKIYFALDAYGFDLKLHKAFFEAISVQHIDPKNQTILKDIVNKNGGDSKKFLDMYNSFAVNVKYKNVIKETAKYELSATPTLLVNGKYFVSPSISGGHEAAIKVLNHLVSKNLQ